MTLLNLSITLSRDIFKRYIFKNIAINVRYKMKMVNVRLYKMVNVRLYKIVNVRLYKMFSEEQIKQIRHLKKMVQM